MRQEIVHYFTSKEEQFVNLLIEIGTQKNVAIMLVFLVNIKEATSRDIERGTDLRQPEVSMAIKYLADQGWITHWEIPSDRKGRPVKKYALAIPVPEIMTHLERQKMNEAKNQLALIKKMRRLV